MNFKTKALIAAVALAATGAANAAIQGAATGNSELVFSAYANGVGYTFDTGVNLTDLIGTQFNTNTAVGPVSVAGTGVIYDFALTGFDSFLSQAGAAGDVQWNMVGGDGSGIRRLLQTVAQAPAAMINDKMLLDSVGAIDIYTTPNNQLGTHLGDNSVDGYSINTPNDGAAYAGLFGNNFTGKSTLLNAGGLDAALDLYVLHSKGTSASTSNFGAFAGLLDGNGDQLVARTYLDGNTYHLQIAALAPVPEPSEYAMLLAGLGLIGMAARRRLK